MATQTTPSQLEAVVGGPIVGLTYAAACKRIFQFWFQLSMASPYANTGLLVWVIDGTPARDFPRCVSIGVGCETAGRRFPAQSGIIGTALNTKQPALAVRQHDNYDDYLAELIAKWKYLPADAKKCNPATMSCYAIPIVDANEVVQCVVYLDSKEKDLFTKETIQLINMACAGIAIYIKRRYLG